MTTNARLTLKDLVLSSLLATNMVLVPSCICSNITVVNKPTNKVEKDLAIVCDTVDTYLLNELPTATNSSRIVSYVNKHLNDIQSKVKKNKNYSGTFDDGYIVKSIDLPGQTTPFGSDSKYVLIKKNFNKIPFYSGKMFTYIR